MLTLHKCLCTIVLLTVVNVAVLISEGVNAQVKKKQKAPPCASGISSCPAIGCGGGDPELNRQKNRFDNPHTPQIKAMTLDEIRNLPQPKSWVSGSDRFSIRGIGKEGTPVSITGILQKVKQEGAESCNCKLTSKQFTDLHLVIVSAMSDPEATSVTVEMTPRIRAQGHSTYMFDQVKPIQGQLVRVTGWLTLDTEHIKRPLVRATNWEVHPITKFEFCSESTVEDCDAHNGWQAL